MLIFKDCTLNLKIEFKTDDHSSKTGFTLGQELQSLGNSPFSFIELIADLWRKSCAELREYGSKINRFVQHINAAHSKPIFSDLKSPLLSNATHSKPTSSSPDTLKAFAFKCPLSKPTP